MLNHARYLLTALLLVGANNALADYDPKRFLTISQEAVGKQLSDLDFTDTRGQKVSLREFRGKPLIISLIYSSCVYICTTTTRSLAKQVELAQASLGTEAFHVISVGFDSPRDTPESMAQFARNQNVDLPNWRFLSLEQALADRLIQELGFSYVPSPRGFDHIIQATMVDEDGLVYRQIYGEAFPLPHLVEPLKELLWNRPKVGQDILAEISDRVRYFCTRYDPATDSYKFDISYFIGLVIGGGIILLGILTIVREYRKRRHPV